MHCCLNALFCMINVVQMRLSHTNLVMTCISYQTYGPCRPNTHCRCNALFYMITCRPNPAITHKPDHDLYK